MLIEILKHTPRWVFVLFLVLVALGYSQSRDRTVSRRRAAVLPAVMIALSFSGMLSAFGAAPFGIACWVAGFAAAIAIGIRTGGPHGVKFSAETRTYSIPGSWVPLALMMAIFFTKYAVGVIQGRQLAISAEPLFIALVAFCYGIYSGLFAARVIRVRRAMAHAV